MWILRVLSWTSLVLSFTTTPGAASCVRKHADVVFLNGSIYTLDARSTKAEALAVTEGHINFVGKKANVASLVGANTTVIDLAGRTLMPGLVDAHMHILGGGRSLVACNLNYQPLNLSAVLQHVQSCMDAEPTKNTANDWLEVVNMDWPSLNAADGPLTKANLDVLKTARPIFLRSSDFHTVWTNSRALELANITASTPDPPGGKIEHLPNGEPSGLLQDDARDLIAPPPPSTADDIKAVKAALKLLRESGITSFQEASTAEVMAGLFKAVKDEGALSARGWFDYMIPPIASPDAVSSTVSEIKSVQKKWNDPAPLGPAPTYKWHAIKAFLDGVITYPASTGAVIEPWYRPVGNSSVWAPDNSTWPKVYWDVTAWNLFVEQLLLNGIDIQAHADADMAVRVGLNAVERVRSLHPNLTDYRVGLAHDELTHPDDWSRFAELKVDAIMSFQWAQPSSFWVPGTFNSLGPKRQNYLEAWGEIANRGRPITYGSDWPIDPLDPWLALKTGVTRAGDPQNPNSPASQGPQFEGVLLTGPSLSREQTLKAYTIQSAKFLRADHAIGSLEVGKLADIIVLEKDFFKVPDAELGRQKVLLTMVGGETVFVADGQNFGANVTAKFPNGDVLSRMLEKKTVGGFEGRQLSEDGIQAVKRLYRRGNCDHGHDAHHHLGL